MVNKKVITCLFLFFQITLINTIIFPVTQFKPVYKYLSEEFNTSNGLPHNTIYSIDQDKDGFLWIGTDRGLVRYDGRNFDIFNRTNTPEIPGDALISVVNDNNGSIWIASYSGWITQYKNGKFSKPIFPGYKKTTKIWKLFPSDDGGLWIGTIGEGLIHMSKGKKTHISFPKYGSQNIRAIKYSSKKMLFVGTENGLFVKNRNRFKKIELYPKKKIFVMSLLPGKKNRLWIGTDKDLIFGELSADKLKIISIIEQGNIIRDIRSYNDAIWIASEEGLKRIVNGKTNFEFFKSDFFYNPLVTLFPGRENSLFVGSAGRGLGKLFRRSIFVIDENKRFGRYNMNSVIEDSNKQIWVGTDGKGLFILNNKELISLLTKKFNSKHIFSLYKSSNGDIWTGTENGLFIFKNGKPDHFYNPYPSLKKNVISINKDFSGNMLFGTKRGGLIVQNLRDKRKPFKHFLNNLSVYSIRRSPNNRVWVGTNDGLWIIMNKGNITNSDHPGLKGIRIYDICIETESVIWIAAGKHGLYGIINDKLIDFVFSPTTDKLKILSILRDKNNKIWLSTDNGIISIKRNELLNFKKGNFLTFTEFGTENGMMSTVCKGESQPAGVITLDGKIIFPTRSGLVYIDSTNSNTNSIAPSVKITGFFINGKPKNILNNIKLSSNIKKILIKTRVISHRFPKKMKIRFKLSNRRKKFEKITDSDSITYENLPPGKYKLNITAVNGSGTWNFRGRSLEFTISKPFFQSFIFQVIFFPLAFWSFIFLIRILSNVKKKRELKTAKYRDSNISVFDRQMYITKLRETVEKEKLYLDPNIKITDISSRMGVPRKLLSQLINEVLEENFKNFINRYRIEFAKKKMSNLKKKGTTLLRIAYESGFNSKSAFNSAFKKFTGIIPSEFRKKNKR